MDTIKCIFVSVIIFLSVIICYSHLSDTATRLLKEECSTPHWKCCSSISWLHFGYMRKNETKIIEKCEAEAEAKTHASLTAEFSHPSLTAEFSKDTEGNEATDYKSPSEKARHKCYSWLCFTREENVLQENGDIDVNEAFRYVNKSFNYYTIAEPVIAAAESCAKFANAYARKLASIEEIYKECNPASFQFHHCLQFHLFSHCPASEKAKGKICDKSFNQARICTDHMDKIANEE